MINLWTREVNDIRDGLIADLDSTPRIHVLAVGLLVIALLVSPLLTVFLASLGLLVWLTARVLNRDARAGDRVGAARRFGSALPAARRPGLAPDRPDLRRGRLRPPAVRRTPRSVSPGRHAADLSPVARSTPAPACSTEPPDDRAGLLGYNVVVNDQISIATMLILVVSLAGLAYPISEWLRLAESDSSGQPVGARNLRVPGTAARAAPERGSSLPQRLEGTDRVRKRRAREPVGPAAARGDLARDPRRFAAPPSWARTKMPSSPWSA